MTGDRSAAHALGELLECMRVLRSECPWDRVQTHATLRRHLLEETHEALEVLDAIAVAGGDPDAASFDDLCEELGDVLFQVVFHAHLAAEAGHFTMRDVIDGVRGKLVARHPVVFDTGNGDATDGAVPGDPGGWERAKVTEKGRSSVMDGIPASLPALAYATKVVSKARAVAPELVAGLGAGVDADDIPPRLLDLVVDARRTGVDAEAELRSLTRAVERRVRAREDGAP